MPDLSKEEREYEKKSVAKVREEIRNAVARSLVSGGIKTDELKSHALDHIIAKANRRVTDERIDKAIESVIYAYFLKRVGDKGINDLLNQALEKQFLKMAKEFADNNVVISVDTSAKGSW